MRRRMARGDEMPKMKPHSGAAKRFRKTGRGKVVRGRANVSHYLEHKPSSRKRRLQRSTTVSKPDEARVNKMMGG